MTTGRWAVLAFHGVERFFCGCWVLAVYQYLEPLYKDYRKVGCLLSFFAAACAGLNRHLEPLHVYRSSIWACLCCL